MLQIYCLFLGWQVAVRICCLEDIFRDTNTHNHFLQSKAAIFIILILIMSEKNCFLKETLWGEYFEKWMFEIISIILWSDNWKQHVTPVTPLVGTHFLKLESKYFESNFKSSADGISVNLHLLIKFRTFWWLCTVDRHQGRWTSGGWFSTKIFA